MEVIKAKNGRPFSTEDKAQAALKEAELHPDTHGVYPMDDGWVLAKHADMVMQLGAVVDELKKRPAPRPHVSEDVDGASGSAGRLDRPLQDEPYWWVTFHGRSDGQEAEHIELGWQGDRITCRRESEICLPQRFLNVADGAVQQLFEPTRRSENPYKKAGVIRRRAYTKIRAGTREEFLKMLNEGNDLTRRDMALADRRADE